MPPLAILRAYLDAHLRRAAGRSGDDLIFGRASQQAFYASTVDGRAKRAWAAANKRERESAECEGREPALLTPISLHLCRHTFASLMIDSGQTQRRFRSSWPLKIQTTFDVYGHLLLGSRDEVRERMYSYLHRS